MRLDLNSIENKAHKWQAAGIDIPKFDINKVQENTRRNPKWVHFGAGNIFRGFIANAHQELIEDNKADTGIIAVESFDYEVIDKIYRPYDNLTLRVIMNGDGKFDKKVIGSIVEAITADKNRTSDYNRLIEIFENPSLQMVSFTITEKGYCLTDASGEYLSVIKKDLVNGFDAPIHTMSIITSLMYRRYKKGEMPITLVSTDNCSHNGDKLKNAVLTIAKEWCGKGFVEKGFISYLENEGKVAFPLTMIDKITPRPSDTVKNALEQNGIEDMDVVITSKKTYMAPFVNAEVCEYLVIEDKFTNGRPCLEEAGIIFTDRETVNKIETMKVTTCLNPLHTALAVTGCLLGYSLIADEMKDKTLNKLVNKIGYDEGLKVVVDPGIINPKKFLDEVVNERFTNPYIPDTPQRIATDTSQKVSVRFGETIKSYMKREDLDSASLVAIPLAIAAWCRYLMGIDDNGNEFEISPDPLAGQLRLQLEGIKLGDTKASIKDIISNKTIFGVDLYEAGLGYKIESMFLEMIEGKGAVLKTMVKYI